MTPRRSLARIVALATTLCACTGKTAPDATPPPFGDVRTAVSGALTASVVTRATLTISPGSGSYFSVISTELSRTSGGWTAFVSNVPAGSGRFVEVVAFDVRGDVVFRGGTVVKVAPGDTTSVSLVMQQSPGAPPAPYANPVVSLVLPVPAVAPGGSVQLTADATDPGGRPLALGWTATCGTLDNAALASTTWTAPTIPYQRCQLSFTASSAFASTTVWAAIDVLPDPNTRSVMGRRDESCWEGTAGSSQTFTSTVIPADVQSRLPPDALVQTTPGVWTRYPGGHVGSDGTFFPGSFGSDGAFYIPGLPPLGGYVLAFADPGGPALLVDTDASFVDLGFDQLGRCAVADPLPGTTVSFQLSQLDPWDAAASALQAASLGVDAFAALASGAQLAAGATDAPLSVAWTGPVLFGDGLWVSEVSPALDPSGFPYRRASRFAQFWPVTFTNGGSAALVAALTPAAQTGALPVQWDNAAFERSAQDLAPATRVLSTGPHRLSVKALPLWSSLAPLPSAGALELATFDQPTGTVGVGLAAPLAYGQFLPAPWSEWREVRYGVSVGYQASPTSAALPQDSFIQRRDALPAGTGTVGPLLTPVRVPLLNGASALADQSGVTGTPTFSWTPPAVGSPSVYVLEVFALSDVAGQTVATPVLRYLTGSTSVTVPTGYLAGAGPFFARITAIAGARPYLSAPLRGVRAESRATALTGTFTP
jgi:hypothetical protein